MKASLPMLDSLALQDFQVFVSFRLFDCTVGKIVGSVVPFVVVYNCRTSLQHCLRN